MYWDMVGATGEWAGAIAVVVTLIYLSSQIRQSKLTTQQDMEQRRIEQANRFLLLPAENAEFAELMVRFMDREKALGSWELAEQWDCSPAEAFRVSQYWVARCGSWEEYYLSPTRNPERWATVERRIATMLSQEPGMSCWQVTKQMYAPRFVARVDELLAAPESD